MRTGLIAVVTVVLIVYGKPAPARIFGPERHEVDPAQALEDTMPPSPPVVLVERITRGRGSVLLGDGNMRDLETDRYGSVSIRVVQLMDDSTPEKLIGLRVLPCDSSSIIRGPEYDFRPRLSPKSGVCSFPLVWEDGATEVQEPISERFLIYAIDLAGNLSAEADTILIVDPGRP